MNIHRLTGQAIVRRNDNPVSYTHRQDHFLNLAATSIHMTQGHPSRTYNGGRVLFQNLCAFYGEKPRMIESYGKVFLLLEDYEGTTYFRMDMPKFRGGYLI